MVDKTNTHIIHTDAVFLQDVSRSAFENQRVQCLRTCCFALHVLCIKTPLNRTKRRYDDCDVKVVNDRTLVEDFKF